MGAALEKWAEAQIQIVHKQVISCGRDHPDPEPAISSPFACTLILFSFCIFKKRGQIVRWKERMRRWVQNLILVGWLAETKFFESAPI